VQTTKRSPFLSQPLECREPDLIVTNPLCSFRQIQNDTVSSLNLFRAITPRVVSLNNDNLKVSMILKKTGHQSNAGHVLMSCSRM
jgi:hypothetical protein